MSNTVRSFAKINLGLSIGPVRPDGFHELRTVYQTIALHDILRVSVTRGNGVEIRCADPRVPKDESNTCYRIVQRAASVLKSSGRVIIDIEKRLPVQGGLGGASGNAVAALLAFERAVKKQLPAAVKLRIAGEVGSDLPLFLIGGTVLGVEHGEDVYPLPDLPPTACVLATPEIGVSTPKAFADWDAMTGADLLPGGFLEKSGPGQRPGPTRARKLTGLAPSDRMNEFGRTVSAWLSGWSQSNAKSGRLSSGVPVSKGRGRAETWLLDLVHTGIENDFEQVVFPQYPELCEVKRVLAQSGAFYASLSGSGSALYGLFASPAAASKAAARMRKMGIPAVATTTLTRRHYWQKIFD